MSSGGGKLKSELLRHAVAVIDEQEQLGGPMLVYDRDIGCRRDL